MPRKIFQNISLGIRFLLFSQDLTLSNISCITIIVLVYLIHTFLVYLQFIEMAKINFVKRFVSETQLNMEKMNEGSL